jgi:serine/threonine-protein kinase
VALKVLDPALEQDVAFRERFIRESRVVAGLEHPNIVTIYDAGEADGLLYVSMRYVEGTDLERLLETEGRLDPAIAISIVSQSAAALDAAHAEGLVHRGVRPADILLERREGRLGRAFLSDFGITKHVAATTRLTRTGSFAGTVDYVAPEVIRGESDVDGRADVYSLGCVLYRCVVGEVPFPRESELVTIFAHLNDPPPRPSERHPGLPSAIDAVIERALAKPREGRFETCGEFAEAAARAMGSSVPPQRAADPVPRASTVTSSRRGGRGIRVATVAAVTALAVVGGTMLARSLGKDPDPEPSPPSGETGSSFSPDAVVIAAAGEIACNAHPYVPGDIDHCQYDDTSRLLQRDELSAVLALGDNQYETGTFNEYVTYYDRWWGKVKTITEPVPGDHEYNHNPESRAHGYFAYWGTPAEGHDGFGYRSFDLPHGCAPGSDLCWHIVALNSELCLLPSGCGPAPRGTTPGAGNEMYRWLKRDLAEHPNDTYGCTLAFWHHPLFSYSQGSGATPEVEPLWQLLYDAGADVVLNSNSHNYQRWEPQDPAGRPDPARGIRQFVIGTGGVKKTSLTSDVWPAGLAAAQDTTFGVIKIELQGTGFTWQWVSAEDQPAFSDDTRTEPVACH